MTNDSANAPYYEANRARWDESVAIHAASEGYDLAGFLRGAKTLYQVEMDEVGDVAGKSLLHLQCLARAGFAQRRPVAGGTTCESAARGRGRSGPWRTRERAPLAFR